MIGCYDFCGHYEWTFEWLREQGGQELVKIYWDEAIHRDSQIHASKLIGERGFEGMKEYWGPTLDAEGPVAIGAGGLVGRGRIDDRVGRALLGEQLPDGGPSGVRAAIAHCDVRAFRGGEGVPSIRERILVEQ